MMGIYLILLFALSVGICSAQSDKNNQRGGTSTHEEKHNDMDIGYEPKISTLSSEKTDQTLNRNLKEEDFKLNSYQEELQEKFNESNPHGNVTDVPNMEEIKTAMKKLGAELLKEILEQKNEEESFKNRVKSDDIYFVLSVVGICCFIFYKIIRNLSCCKPMKEDKCKTESDLKLRPSDSGEADTCEKNVSKVNEEFAVLSIEGLENVQTRGNKSYLKCLAFQTDPNEKRTSETCDDFIAKPDALKEHDPMTEGKLDYLQNPAFHLDSSRLNSKPCTDFKDETDEVKENDRTAGGQTVHLKDFASPSEPNKIPISNTCEDFTTKPDEMTGYGPMTKDKLGCIKIPASRLDSNEGGNSKSCDDIKTETDETKENERKTDNQTYV